MSHHFIEVRDLYYTYPDKTTALQGVSFRITHGESVGIVGANGAGKTTLFLHLNGFLFPDNGTVTVGDTVLTKKTRSEIRKRVGIVFQNPDDQLFMPRVFDDVAFGPLNLGMDPEKVSERVENSLERVGALHLINRQSHKLSGGQKRAVTIASVIAMQPDILVMDEPGSHLDPGSRRQLIKLLKGFKHTKLIASHDLDMILDTCERCIVLGDGKVQADGPTETILTSRELLEANHLELPLSRQNI